MAFCPVCPALDFLDKLLQFAPEKRLSVEQALAHPYLALLHDPSDEPVCDMPFDFSFESQPMTKESLKEVLWEEVMSFVPPPLSKSHSNESTVRYNNIYCIISVTVCFFFFLIVF